MARQLSPWVRWLGWTALYALVFYSSRALYDVTGWGASAPWGAGAHVLVPAALAFAIGARFRSWWWGLGPLAAVALPAAMLVLRDVSNPDLGSDIEFWLVLIGWALVAYGALLSLIGLAGVWRGQRRHLAASSRKVGPGIDTSPVDAPVTRARRDARGPRALLFRLMRS